jgi:quercetin dioxygenase-like cupin family protein
MVRAGDVFVNPVTGSRVVFRKTAAETNGEVCEFDFFLPPRTAVNITEHAHPLQEETTQVVAGSLRGTRGSEPHRLSPGETMVVPPGIYHAWGNDSDEESHWIVSFRPALKSEGFLEAIWGLAEAGFSGPDGLPKNLFQGVVIISEFRDEIRPRMPWLKWKIGVDVLAPIGRLLGHSAYRKHRAPAEVSRAEA